MGNDSEGADELIREWAEATASLRMRAGPEPVGAVDLVLRPAATEAAIRAAEERLGTLLPTSYRSFLLRTNGTAVGVEGSPDWGLLYPAERIVWLRDVDPGWIEAWWSLDDELGITSGERPAPGTALDVRYFSPAANALLISEPMDRVMDLLVPVAGQDEWECWQTGKEGAIACASFADMLRWRITRLRRFNGLA